MNLVILLLLGLPCLAVEEQEPVKEVFHISTGQADGSCDAYLERLEKYWDQIGTLTTMAIANLQTDFLYEEAHNKERKLADAFSGFKPDYDPEYDPPYDQPKDDLILDKWEKTLSWWQDIEDFLRTRNVGSRKPKLMCDSTFMKFQRGTDFYLDSKGNKVPKNPKDPAEGFYTLAEWEAKKGRNVNNYWYFWIDVPGGGNSPDKAYVKWPRSAYPAKDGHDYPWELHPNTGEPDYCSSPSRGQTLGYAQHGLQSTIVILCPKSFDDEYGDNDLPDGEMEPKTRLDVMGILAQTLFHELVHVCHPGTESPDALVREAGRYPDGGKWYNWPEFKAGFVTKDFTTDSAMDCLDLQLWDKAHDVVEHVDGFLSNKNPESYVWYALANWMQTQYGQEWFTGICQDAPNPVSRSVELANLYADLGVSIGNMSVKDMWIAV